MLCTGRGRYRAGMLVVTRYVVPESEGAVFAEQARAALDALRVRPGCRSAVIGRAVDDPTLWTLTTRWESVGAYRRGLSGYEVKVHAVPLMYRSIDEATAFEELTAWDAAREGGSGEVVDAEPALAADAASVNLGEAATPRAPREPG
jgi:heme-degrading monooxygenase HmoA